MSDDFFIHIGFIVRETGRVLDGLDSQELVALQIGDLISTHGFPVVHLVAVKEQRQHKC